MPFAAIMPWFGLGPLICAATEELDRFAMRKMHSSYESPFLLSPVLSEQAYTIERHNIGRSLGKDAETKCNDRSPSDGETV
jgi:hypothetical protein